MPSDLTIAARAAWIRINLPDVPIEVVVAPCYIVKVMLSKLWCARLPSLVIYLDMGWVRVGAKSHFAIEILSDRTEYLLAGGSNRIHHVGGRTTTFFDLWRQTLKLLVDGARIDAGLRAETDSTAIAHQGRGLSVWLQFRTEGLDDLVLEASDEIWLTLRQLNKAIFR